MPKLKMSAFSVHLPPDISSGAIQWNVPPPCIQPEPDSDLQIMCAFACSLTAAAHSSAQTKTTMLKTAQCLAIVIVEIEEQQFSTPSKCVLQDPRTRMSQSHFLHMVTFKHSQTFYCCSQTGKRKAKPLCITEGNSRPRGSLKITEKVLHALLRA